MMKNLLLLLFAFALTGCNYNQLNINGTAEGVTNGTVILRDPTGQTVSGVNIKDGKFTIKGIRLTYNGYGTLSLSQAGKGTTDFELYLEPGDYAVEFDKEKKSNYPKITSKSNIQTQLSAYQALSRELTAKAQKTKDALDQKYKDAVRSSQTWDAQTTAIANQAHEADKKLTNIAPAILMAYVTKYPDNAIAVHLMQGMNFDADPATYLAIYKKLSQSQQNSDEGKPIGDKLNAIIHLAPGQPAPAIAGATPDGKKVDPKDLKKKLVLVEFWRAANYASRTNHQAMMKRKTPVDHFNDVGIISISFDKKRDWWLGSMRDDKLTWTQVSDLKGTDSPNFINWGINDLPTYYLLDGAGRIIERDLPFEQIDPTINDYLAKHR